MTVISALLKPEYIIVTTDSMLSSIDKNGKRIPDEKAYQKHLKYVAYPQLRCIASYFGMANIEEDGEYKFHTIDLLRKMVPIQSDFRDIMALGEHLRDELIVTFNKYNFSTRRSIGIHLTGFESFNGQSIPEMFYISGDSVSKTVQVSRRTFLDWQGSEREEVIPLAEQRQMFHNLISQEPFYYNNGDNEMYNNFLKSYSDALTESHRRGVLNGGINNESYYLRLSRAPVIAIKEFQRTYYMKESILVGGKIRTIIMYPDGQTKTYDTYPK